MREVRVFLAATPAVGALVALPPEAARHLGTVLRLRAGEPLVGVDPDGGEWDLGLLGPGEARALAPRPPRAVEAATAVTLAVAVPRGERMDWVVEKATELGVAALLPLTAQRSDLAGAVGAARIERWCRLARAAAEQSGRRRIPRLLPASTLGEALRDRSGIRLLAHPAGPTVPLADLLGPLRPVPGGVLVAVGPEGGWSPTEVAAAQEAGAGLLQLGPRILRVETAALTALTLVLAGCGDLGCA